MIDTSDPGFWAMVSFAIAALSAMVAGGLAYFVLAGQARDPSGETPESLLDRFGIACFRVANRVVISTFGGAVLVGLFRMVTRQPKRRRA